MKKLLVISRGAWNNNNSVGNTLNNLFSDCQEFEFHNVYLRAELPGENPCKTIFQITERGLLQSLLSTKEAGSVLNNSTSVNDADKEERIYSRFQNKNLYSLWFIREFLWIFGHWRKNLKEYISDINPDIIFMPVFGCVYAHRVLRTISSECKAKVVLFHADDHYTLRHANISPLFWIYRFWLRTWIKHSVKKSSINYCISEQQILDYNKCFNTKCILLQKFGDFSGNVRPVSFNSPLKLVFTGNLECGRWKTLAGIAQAVHNINNDSIHCTLDIYTATKLSDKQRNLFDKKKGVCFRGFVQSTHIPEIQYNSDILIHAESFAKRDMLRVRHSFSTKIIDYLSRGRCILVVGPKDIASVHYFIKNDSGYVVTNRKMIQPKLMSLINNKKLLEEYSIKAWDCGYRNNDFSRRSTFILQLLSL